MDFKKYQGTGNDFIMIDGRNIDFKMTTQQIEQICHRRFGIGADGLIVLKNHADYDFEMLYHNSDGKVGSMCGNGGRCTVKFAFDLGLIKEKTRFLAADGEHLAEVQTDGSIKLKMGELTIFEKHQNYDFLNTGSPHYVCEVQNLENFDVFNEGKKIRNSERWLKEGTNVNFIEIQADSSLFVRTYERGVEDETYSCGTGVTAAAIASHERFGVSSPVQIKTKGGNLCVSFFKNNLNKYNEIYLTGPAKCVFKGKF